MQSRIQLASLAIVSALALALMGAYNSSRPDVPNLPMPKNGAMIYNPGNGDFAGFRIVVDPNGRSAAIDGAGVASNELQPAIVDKFFADLAAAGPLAQLPTGDCSQLRSSDAAQSVEVNAPVIISWRGQRTGALGCVSDARAVKILLDATAIQHALYVQAYRKRVTVAYGPYAGAYQPSAYGSSGYVYTASGFYFQPYSNGGSFSTDRFQNSSLQSGGRFSNGSFDAGIHSMGSPFSSPNFTSIPSGSIPFASPFTGLPSASLYTSSPFSGSPFSGGPTGASPFGASPFSGVPSGSGPPVASHP